MMRAIRCATAVAIATLALAAGASAGTQGWPTTLGNYPVPYGFKSQDALADGSGGVQFVWLMNGVHDIPFGPPLHNHVTNLGVPAGGYSSSGLAVPEDEPYSYASHGASDGAGGLWIVWWTANQLHRLHVGPGGAPVPGEPDSGLVIRNAPMPLAVGIGRTPVEQMVGLGAGGFVLVWPEYNTTGVPFQNRLVAQKYDAAGAPQWTPTAGESGLLITPVSSTAITFRDVASDGAGGVIASYTRAIGAGVTVTRVRANGTLAWSAAGRNLSLAPVPSYGQMIGDGAGGAWVTWWDLPAAGEGRVRVQHVTAGGVPELGPTDANGPSEPSYAVVRPSLAPTPDGGVLVTWYDDGTTGVPPAIRAQELDSSGGPLWGDGSLLLVDDAAIYDQPRAAVEENGAFWLAWGFNDTRARKFDANGQPLSPPYVVGTGGPPFALVRDAGHPSRLVYGVTGMVHVTTLDITVPGADVPGAVPRLALAVRGNPARGARTFSLTLPAAGPVTLDMFDASGRRVAGRAFGALAAGSHAVRLDEAADWPAGLYFVRVRVAGAHLTRRLVQLGR